MQLKKNWLSRCHFGWDKTYEKIESHFYWLDTANEVREYIASCDICQRTNDGKFVKAAPSPNLIAVEPEVWRMVHRSTIYTSIIYYIYCIAFFRWNKNSLFSFSEFLELIFFRTNKNYV